MKHLLFKILATISTGVFFGMWMHNFDAGCFLTNLLILVLFIIQKKPPKDIEVNVRFVDPKEINIPQKDIKGGL